MLNILMSPNFKLAVKHSSQYPILPLYDIVLPSVG